jgi:uncharacterized membrane protein
MEAMSQNMVWDGLFHLVHLATWGIILIGIFMLWSESRTGGVRLCDRVVGQMIFGWGAFNLVEA